MEILTVNEEMLLIIVWQLNVNAYGFPIMKEAMEITKKKISYGSLYNSLNNLIRKGYFSKRDTVVFLHTGGTPALFVYRDELLELLKKE